jgi:hypothetical protein
MKLRPNFIRRASGSGGVDLALGLGGRRVGIRRTAEAAAVGHHPAGAVGLIGAISLVLCPPVRDQAAAAEFKALPAVPRDRLLLGGALALEALLHLPQPGAPAAAACQMLWQLVAAIGAVDRILGGVDALRLGENLGGDLLVAADRRVGGRGGELRAVDANHAGPDQSRLGTEAEHLTKQPRQRLLVAGPKTRDRRVVGHLGRADTRKATSSRQRRSIPREERSPTQ